MCSLGSISTEQWKLKVYHYEASSYKNRTQFPHVVLRPGPNFRLEWKAFEEGVYHLMRQLPHVRSLVSGQEVVALFWQVKVALGVQKVQGEFGSSGFWNLSTKCPCDKGQCGSICINFPYL